MVSSRCFGRDFMRCRHILGDLHYEWNKKETDDEKSTFADFKMGLQYKGESYMIDHCCTVKGVPAAGDSFWSSRTCVEQTWLVTWKMGTPLSFIRTQIKISSGLSLFSLAFT